MNTLVNGGTAGGFGAGKAPVQRLHTQAYKSQAKDELTVSLTILWVCPVLDILTSFLPEHPITIRTILIKY